MSEILVNMIRTPDGTLLQSKHRHDYVTYFDKNGQEYMVDGGHDYLRRIVHDDYPYEEMSLYEEDTIESLREYFVWGTRGKDGKQPLSWIKLKEMMSDHIEAILDTQTHISDAVRELFQRELNYRLEHEI
jgi:predicted phosphohydrolase